MADHVPHVETGIKDVIQVRDRFYILATSARADDRTRVLKHGDTFAVFDHFGDILPFGLGEQGLYHEGTRFLSRLDLRLGDERPLLLSSTVKRHNDAFVVDLTNPDIAGNGDLILPRDLLHIFRSKFVWNAVCYEHLRIANYGLLPVAVPLCCGFDADFADIFEVRGTRRARRGDRLPDQVEAGRVVLAYRGLDGVVRRLRIECEPAPSRLSSSEIEYEFHLAPKESVNVALTFHCDADGSARQPLPPERARSARSESIARLKTEACEIATSNEQFNDWLSRSRADLHLMMTETPHGPYPYAGVPWFSTAFGRDGIITALELLWIEPSLARGVLAYLAATQAAEIDPEQDAEPGKILHETRRGEMAALREIPFGQYYGSVDATPLFVVLAGAYYDRTRDREFIESIWKNVERALAWIDTYGDADGDGFIEYIRHTAAGLRHQGWKDSEDSVSHEDGTLAEAPVTLCEVQGYVFDARQRAARLAEALGRAELAERLRRQAEELKRRFEREFWSEDLCTYVLALDANKRPCRVRSSNAGHLLFSGIASGERAAATAGTLLDARSYSGWGIRTLTSSERRYNPMSYHNGSVWPHDNAIIAAGCARYGFTDLAARIMTGLFDTSIFVELHRLPELFCGFKRRPDEGPTLYPVACAPQAWAAGAVFMLLQSSLGLTLLPEERRISFFHPVLPPFLHQVRISNLQIGDAVVDLRLERHPHDVGIHVLRREGDVEIVAVK
jgi:glycogen debranching enzyme